MMIFHSIKTKLIFLVVGTFLILNLSILLITRIQLTGITNASQASLYREKISIIIKEMERTEERLEKTGSREVYIRDFQNALLKNFRRTYYTSEGAPIYPFIVDRDLSVILHPILPPGDETYVKSGAFQWLRENPTADRYTTYQGVRKWYISERFTPWGWTVVYTVPLKDKYRDINNFIRILLLTMILYSTFIVPLLILLTYGITSPIIKLTAITEKIARGELDQTINVKGGDEVSLLAHSIEVMQHSIKEKIQDLNHEMEEKSRMEEQLIQARKMDAIGQLAGGVAHDFNNMLAGISGAAQLLEQDGSIKKESREYVKMIIETAERAADLTGKLLAFGRKRAISTSAVNIHNVIHDTVTLLDRTLDKKIHLILRERAENTVFLGNFSDIQNCIMNLSINAAHAMPGGGDLTLETRNIELDENYCRYSTFEISPGPYIELVVKDTGTGIEPEFLSKIFEPFYTSKKLGKGTGLGLAMVYGTVQDHHGAITVYSEPGKGTVFHLYLPLSGEGEEGIVIRREREKPRPYNRNNERKRLLLVDDEEVIRKTGKPILEMMGFSVSLAKDGEEGLSLYRQDPASFDLVITDMIMPGMNGSDLFRKIRELNGACPVIISSGFTREQDLDELREEGLSGFIQKPFRKDDLEEEINRIFSEDQSGESRPVS